MQFLVPIIGFGLVVVGRLVLGTLRASYLMQASNGVSVDLSKEIVLRYAMWNYIYPLLSFGGCILMSWAIYQGSPHPESILVYKLILLLCAGGGIFLLYRQLTAQVTIFGGKLTYTEGGDRWEFHADDVIEVSFKGFVFLVRLKWQKTVRVPATFAHSEIILAFLRHATDNK